MNAPKRESFASVVELCLSQNSDKAWRQFDDSFAERLEQVFRQTARGRWAGRLREFRPWFVNWVFDRRILAAAYRRLVAERGQGILATDDEQSEFLMNYLAKAARSSAIPAFVSESSSPHDPLIEQANALRAPVEQEASTLLGDVVAHLHPSYRVPFWLRHYRDLGYPPEADISWMAKQCGRTTDEVRQSLDDAIDNGGDAEFPLRASLIAELCGIPPSFDGGQATVDQRVRRARLRLRELIIASGGSDV